MRSRPSRSAVGNLTLANQLTILRIMLIPAFVLLVVYGYMGWALLTLVDAGVQSIDLHYIRSNYTDDNGNSFRFRSKAVVRDQKGRFHNVKIYDVFLSTIVGAASVAPNGAVPARQ